MAFFSREKTFKLENCRDLFNKLEREIKRFKQNPKDLFARVDHAFNVVVTAWHMCDWVCADLTADQKSKLNIKDRKNMQAVARQCRALYLCEQAATASKHWAVYKEYRDPNVSTIVSIAPVRKPEDVHAPTVFEVFFKDEENVIPAEKVFDDALEFWRHFIYQNQIAANDPLPGQ
jgi:hypothetical protein